MGRNITIVLCLAGFIFGALEIHNGNGLWGVFVLISPFLFIGCLLSARWILGIDEVIRLLGDIKDKK